MKEIETLTQKALPILGALHLDPPKNTFKHDPKMYLQITLARGRVLECSALRSIFSPTRHYSLKTRLPRATLESH